MLAGLALSSTTSLLDTHRLIPACRVFQSLVEIAPVDRLPGGGILIQHAGVLQHVGPLSAGSSVAVLEVLSEMVCAEELLAGVALPELVNLLQVADTLLPILVRSMTGCRCTRSPAVTRELFPTVAASVGLARSVGTVVESTVVTVQSRATPAVSTYMETVLVTFRFILVLESVAAE